METKTLTQINRLLMCGAACFMMACNDTSFNLNSESTTFQQSVTSTKVKVDILWVVDNSGSMATSQQAVADNFQAFIQQFQQTNFDYQIAVTTTEAWRAPTDIDDDPTLSRFRDGTAATSFSGVTVIKPDTPNLEQTFITNVTQGTNGSGDERGWQSLQEALSVQANLDEPFPRPDALLAVVMLTDEDDFSHDGNNNVSGTGSPTPDPYNNPALHDPMAYYDFLYNLTNSTPESINFQVSAIAIFDQACQDQLNSGQFQGRKVARRYIPVIQASGGYEGSLCDNDFSAVLSGLSDSIIEKTTAFQITREPIIDTIVVLVNGVEIPNDPVNGWTYDPVLMLITFHGSAIPGDGDEVAVNFDPAGLK